MATDALETMYPGYRASLLNSGTSALTVALQLAFAATTSGTAKRPGAGRIVALPAYACPDLATAAVAAQSRIVLFDIDARTLTPDLASVERCLRLGAQVVVVAHLYGRVSDLRQIRALCDQFGAVLIEDAAQHAGGSATGIRGGAQADLSVLSFGRGKGINAGGGGAILVRVSSAYVPPTPAAAGSSGRALLASLVTELLSSPLVYGIPARIPSLGVGETHYHEPSDVLAMPHGLACLLTQALSREGKERRDRQTREARYFDELAERRWTHASMFTRVDGSGALRTPMALDPAWAERQRKRLAPLGVVRSYPRTLAEYPAVVSRLVEGQESVPGARYLAERVHTLPTHTYVREHDVQAIVQLIGASSEGS